MVTHGWVDRGKDRFSDDIAGAIKERVDSNEWMCGYFEWDGAMVLNSIKSAENARDAAGPQLAKAILKLGTFEHIHLIGHSAGCWAIDSAAKIIEKQTQAQMHITFLDAYVPRKWDRSQLGRLEKTKIKFVEQYYTKDLTFGVTQANLPNALNIDITKADPGITEHKFPLRWYYATITGNYNKNDYRFGKKLYNQCDGLEYGFARSLEAGRENWQKSLKLKENLKAVMIIK
ncbi:MAG: Lipase [Planctomycetes bacterium ADurb.Bin401]|nr:MAG: Lipase [Planctomycetes bacterium ADurb.Bin401]